MVAKRMEKKKQSRVLPWELWLEIFQFLDYESRNHTMPLVCRKFHEFLVPQSGALSALDKNTSNTTFSSTSNTSSTSSTVSRSQSAPTASSRSKHTLHPKLRSRFKITNQNSMVDGLHLVRQQHRESFDTMKHDDAAVAMMAAAPGWGEFDTDEYFEPAVSPPADVLYITIDENTSRAIRASSSATVRDILIAEMNYCTDVMESKRATFELFRKNLLKQYWKEITGVGSLRFWDTKRWTAREEEHVLKTKRAYEKHRRYLDAEERLYTAYDEWKVKRTKASYDLLTDYYDWVKVTNYKI